MKLAPGRILSRLLTGVSLLLTAATFFLFVVMTTPQESEHAILTDQPLTAAAPAVQIAGDAQLHTLLESFPVPVLCNMSGHGLTLVSGASCDVPFEDGVARRATLTYALADGRTLTLESIYPARALALIERDGYSLVGAVQFAGLDAVRMVREDSIRVHAQHSEALYVLTAPQMDYGELSALMAGVQRLSFEAPQG